MPYGWPSRRRRSQYMQTSGTPAAPPGAPVYTRTGTPLSGELREPRHPCPTSRTTARPDPLQVSKESLTSRGTLYLSRSANLGAENRLVRTGIDAQGRRRLNGHAVEHGSLNAGVATVDKLDRGQCLCRKGRWQHDVLHVQEALCPVDRGGGYGVDVGGRGAVDRTPAAPVANIRVPDEMIGVGRAAGPGEHQRRVGPGGFPVRVDEGIDVGGP